MSTTFSQNMCSLMLASLCSSIGDYKDDWVPILYVAQIYYLFNSLQPKCPTGPGASCALTLIWDPWLSDWPAWKSRSHIFTQFWVRVHFKPFYLDLSFSRVWVWVWVWVFSLLCNNDEISLNIIPSSDSLSSYLFIVHVFRVVCTWQRYPRICLIESELLFYQDILIFI